MPKNPPGKPPRPGFGRGHALLLGLFVIGALLISREDRKGPSTKRESPEGRLPLKTDAPVARAEAARQQGKSEEPPAIALSAAEIRIVEERTHLLKDAYRESERRRSKTLVQIEEDGDSVTLLGVTAPASADYAAMNALLGAQLAGLPESSKVYARAYEALVELLRDFSNFPKPVKVLALMVQSDRAIHANPGGFFGKHWFGEYFIEDEAEVLSKDPKDLTVPLSAGGTRYTGSWGDTKDWAFERYGYLLSVEEEAEALPAAR